MSVGTVALLAMILIAYDERVRDLWSRRVVANPTMELAGVSHQVTNAMAFVAAAVRSQSVLHSPLLVFTLAAGTILVVFGERLLSLFGPEFPAGQPALVLLVIGQTVNVAMGPVALLLVMTGHERVLAISTCACGVLNIVLNVVLVPFWGLVGTAMSLAISLSVWNILLAVWIKRRLGIHSTAIGVIGGQTQR